MFTKNTCIPLCDCLHLVIFKTVAYSSNYFSGTESLFTFNLHVILLHICLFSRDFLCTYIHSIIVCDGYEWVLECKLYASQGVKKSFFYIWHLFKLELFNFETILLISLFLCCHESYFFYIIFFEIWPHL